VASLARCRRCESSLAPSEGLVARANAICAETDREIHLGGVTSLGQLARVLEGTEREFGR
jgi:hypothetical protein